MSIKNPGPRRRAAMLSAIICLLLALVLIPMLQAPARAGVESSHYTVSARVSGGHGFVFPSRQSVEKGDFAWIFFSPYSGYHIVSITDNGIPVPISNPYVLFNVRSYHEVIVTYALDKYTVKASVSGGHGSVAPQTQTVAYGGTASVNIAPDAGYHIETILDNSASVPVSNPYVMTGISTNHDVRVTFGINEYAVDAAVSGGHGSVAPATQEVVHGGIASIDITPDAGYYIESIVDNGASQTVADPYVINSVTQDHDVVVSFALNQYDVTAAVSGGHGSVAPPTQSVAHGGTASVAITPDTGYHIESISDNSSEVPVSNPYVISGVSADHDVVVTFAVNEHEVDAAVSGGHGSVYPATQAITYGDKAVIDITPDAGYHIASIVDNTASMPVADPYVINSVTQDHSVVVTFALDQYTVTASVAGGNGSVAPTSQTVAYGGTASIAITPDGGYHVATITDNGTHVPVSSAYVITNASEDHEVVVTFTAAQYMVAALAAGGHGSVAPATQTVAAGGAAVPIDITPAAGYHIAAVIDNGVSKPLTSPYAISDVNENHSVVATFEADQFTVTASAYNSGGTVAPASQTVVNGGTASVAITPGTGYHTEAIIDNGVHKTVTTPYVISGVSADHEVSVLFSLNRYDVTAAVAGGHGSVAPATQEVVHGGIASIDITPDAGYHIESIIDNTASMPVADPYVINSVTQDHDVVVSFALNQYDVTAAVSGGHGSVAPPTQSVAHGGTASVAITPDAGYHTETITDNGVFVPVSNPYVISGVSADHDVVVTFAVNEHEVDAAVSGGHGSASPVTQEVVEGGTAVIDIKPNSGYYVASIVDNGDSMPVADPYVINDVTQDHTVVATAGVDLYTVSASITSGNGTVSPSTRKVTYGGTASIKITPDSGYYLASIIDNGVRVAVSNPYIISDVAADHDVFVTFAHDESPTWYLAEGSTAHGFSAYICVENPTTENLNARLTYMQSDGATEEQVIGLPPLSQVTVNPADTVGASDFSTLVECVQGKSIAVDRTMTWTGPGAPAGEGHCSIGVTAPQEAWYLPEGSSAWGFETWTLIQNPSAGAATVTLTYMIEGSGPRSFVRTVPAHSRVTYSMASDIGTTDASTKVSSSVPVIAERSMYRNNRREGHNSIGADTPSKTFYLAEGTTAWGFATYVLVENPNSSAANVSITCMTPSGPVALDPFAMPPNSRKTVRMNDIPAVANTDFSTRVSADQPVIAERAMYWGEGTPMGEACHDSIGLPSPQAVFYLPDGQTSDGYETYTLVQNPNGSDIQIQVSYLAADGAGETGFVTGIPANARVTFKMSDRIPSGRASVAVLCLTEGKKILAERSMYWNTRGAGTNTIGGF